MYGAATLLIVAGVACAVVIAGVAAAVISIGLIGLGLIAVVGTVFYEVGLSEDRDRASELVRREREAAQRARREEREERERARELRPLSSGRGRLERMRGYRRRLR